MFDNPPDHHHNRLSSLNGRRARLRCFYAPNTALPHTDHPKAATKLRPGSSADKAPTIPRTANDYLSAPARAEVVDPNWNRGGHRRFQLDWVALSEGHPSRREAVAAIKSHHAR